MIIITRMITIIILIIMIIITIIIIINTTRHIENLHPRDLLLSLLSSSFLLLLSQDTQERRRDYIYECTRVCVCACMCVCVYVHVCDRMCAYIHIENLHPRTEARLQIRGHAVKRNKKQVRQPYDYGLLVCRPQIQRLLRSWPRQILCVYGGRGWVWGWM